MKNIHIISTDKPSRLYSYKSIDLYLHSEIVDANSANLNCKNQNIYITSDEPIKEGDYGLIGKDIGKIIISGDGYEFLMGVSISYEYADFYYLQEVCKKIILTDNKDLIKDGVQSIPDEFLEWFVKNSSCEFVKTELLNVSEVLWEEYFKKHGVYPKYPYYEKIIIPKEEIKRKIDTCYNFDMEIGCVQDICRCEQEEPKQEPQFGTKEFNDLAGQYFGGKPSTKLHKGEVVDESYPKEFKQETLEEAVVKYSNNFTGDEGKFAIEDFINGVKWQEERMYSETEVLQLLLRLQQTESYNNLYEWFEQNKKK
jgi:hypothetical protein